MDESMSMRLKNAPPAIVRDRNLQQYEQHVELHDKPAYSYAQM